MSRYDISWGNGIMRIHILFLVSIALLLGSTAVVGADCAEAGQAQDLVLLAWSTYNDKAPLQKEWYEERQVPFALRSREQVAVHLFLEAADLDAEASAAFYNLGVFFLDKDCERSTYYFNKHQEVIPGEEDTLRLLAEIDRCGCGCAHHLLATGKLMSSEWIFLHEETEKPGKRSEDSESPN
jgi:hypothetical protein